jgi:chemotaxis protein CheD
LIGRRMENRGEEDCARGMRIQNWKNRKRVAIDPGEYYVAHEDVLITTLLGSCVSACLYDPYNKIVGMNHFLLGSSRYAKGMPVCTTDAGRYGIHSMELLINEMWHRGAQRGHLKAKAFGGGSILKAADASTNNFFTVGEVNVRFIIEYLQNEKIPLVSSDLGGPVGRVINFDSEDFSVYVRKMAAKGATVVKREEQYWKKSIQKQEETETQIDLWS